MSFKATVFNVMIASPSDTPEECRVAREVILEWNVTHSEDKKGVLLPMSWDSHACSEVGRRPQEIINSRVLVRSDLLIAIFKHRIGSCTGEAISGTVEEISKHCKSGKPAMIYFSKAQIPQDGDLEQFGLVKELRDQLKEIALWKAFDTCDTFRTLLTRELQQAVLEYFKEDLAGNAGALAESGNRNARERDILSEEAKTLLVKMSGDEDGRLLIVQLGQGTVVQVAHRTLNDINSPRDLARLESAAKELLGEQLIETSRFKGGKAFVLTEEGWRRAEEIKQQQQQN